MQHLHYIAVERCLADEAFHVAAVVQKLHTAFARMAKPCASPLLLVL